MIRNAGTLDLEIFLTPYTCDIIEFYFDSNSMDPVQLNRGGQYVTCTHYGSLDYGQMLIPVGQANSDGPFYCADNVINALYAEPNQGNNKSLFNFYSSGFPALGGREGIMLDIPAFVSAASNYPSQSANYCQGVDFFGYNPAQFMQEGQLASVGVAINKYGYGEKYWQTRFGPLFDGYQAIGNYSGEASWIMPQNTFAYLSTYVIANSLGMLIGANPQSSDYAKFQRWDVYGLTEYSPNNSQQEIAGGVGGYTIGGGLDVFEEPAIAAAFDNSGGYGSQVQNAPGFFIGHLQTEYFPGQAGTPVLLDPVAGIYRPVRLHANTAQGQAAISSYGGYMSLKYAPEEGQFLFLNAAAVANQPFTTLRLGLDFVSSIIPPSMIHLPCFNPCIPAIVL